MVILTVRLDLLVQQTVVLVLVSTLFLFLFLIFVRTVLVLTMQTSMRLYLMEYFLSSIYAWAITTHHWLWVGPSSTGDFPFQWCRGTFSFGMLPSWLNTFHIYKMQMHIIKNDNGCAGMYNEGPFWLSLLEFNLS